MTSILGWSGETELNLISSDQAAIVVATQNGPESPVKFEHGRWVRTDGMEEVNELDGIDDEDSDDEHGQEAHQKNIDDINEFLNEDEEQEREEEREEDAQD